MSTPESRERQHLLHAAREWLGDNAPVGVVEAKARCYAWRPFRGLLSGQGPTAEQRAQHEADIAMVDAYEALLPEPYVGADPMGDE